MAKVAGKSSETAPSPAGDHVRQAGAGAEDGAEDVVLELRAPIVEIQGQDRADAGPRRIQHERLGCHPHRLVDGRDLGPGRGIADVTDDTVEARVRGERLVRW